MFDFLKQADEIETEVEEPVDVAKIEELIKMIDLAQSVNADFKLSIILRIDGFVVDSINFAGIKFVKKTKNEPNKIVISHYNSLLLIDTMINVDDIIHFDLSIKFTDSGD